MKLIMNIVKTMMLAALSAVTLLAVSCDAISTEPEQEPQLEVNANNISGQWELIQWNEAGLAEGTYVYLDIVRNDRT